MGNGQVESWTGNMESSTALQCARLAGSSCPATPSGLPRTCPLKGRENGSPSLPCTRTVPSRAGPVLLHQAVCFVSIISRHHAALPP